MFLWVVSEDLPSAYLVTDQAKTPCAALKVYCDLMEDWIRAVSTHGGLSDTFPVSAEPTQANAAMLKKRVAFLREEDPAFE